ncbi:MAG TPA: hypothetical protein VN029_09425, partial [Sphingomonas sp.]|nr:hypothetical protein [Sphingomonas sp.]
RAARRPLHPRSVGDHAERLARRQRQLKPQDFPCVLTKKRARFPRCSRFTATRLAFVATRDGATFRDAHIRYMIPVGQRVD